MATIHRTEDTDLLTGTVAVIGYGSQGHAHALNLRDSGVSVVVGLREGSPSKDAAEDAGLEVRSIADAVRGAQVVALLLPDHVQKGVWDEHVAPNLDPGAAVLFAHGLNVHFGRIAPPAGHDVIMVAPKAPGHRVRELYVSGAGTPGLVAVHEDASGSALELALAYGAGIGCGARRAARDDVRRGDRERPLRRAGRPLRRRPGARAGRLRHARRGGLPAGDRVLRVPERAEAHRRPALPGRARVHALLRLRRRRVRRPLARARASSTTACARRCARSSKEIQSGAFADELFADDEAGRPRFAELRKAGEERAREIERVGKELRSLAGVEGLLGAEAHGVS